MGRDSEFLSTVGAVYRGAVDPERWTLALERVSKLFDGAFSVVEIRRSDRPEVSIETSTVILDQNIHESYGAHYGLICPRAALLGALPIGGVMHDDQVGDEVVLDRHEYYTDFLAPQGLRYFLACKVEALSNVDVVISVQRSRDAGRATADDITRFTQLAPHLASAYALRLSFGRHLSLAGGFDRVSDMLGAAFMLVDAECRPLYVSRAAEVTLAAAFPALSLTRDGLVDGRGGGRIIDGLLGPEPTGALRAGGTINLAEAGLRLRVAPLLDHAERLPLSGVAAAVIIERMAGPGCTHGLLRLRFGLTERESEVVADLCDGSSPREIADARSLSLSTVRTHIARARSKTGARSIAELVLVSVRESTPGT